MLQQTQAERVAQRFPAFVAEFPSATDCAAASPGAVVRAWTGLGYNRRAVNLHRAAERIVADHAGAVPSDLDALLALPGVGPYTARAVLVFAFGHDIGLIDTNAGRFVSRALAGRALGRDDAQATANAAVPVGRGWEWGQAVFDLGALVCTRRSPGCDSCPVRAHCAWAARGFAAPDPIDASAGISRPQSKFKGSFREGRGRLVARLADGPIAARDIAAAAGWANEPDRAAQAANALVADGLAELRDDGSLALA
jgi:A/G-specific adenine glycosylase